jgi:hypothetical protein
LAPHAGSTASPITARARALSHRRSEAVYEWTSLGSIITACEIANCWSAWWKPWNSDLIARHT